ncbi:MAG: hypothetical protein HFH14_01295 [Lachnospiraceae bacterium]|nr:hypothetical protein [Lachnospiraceae bacterium]
MSTIISAVCDREDITSAYSVSLSENVTVVAILDVAVISCSSEFILPNLITLLLSLRIAAELF